MILSRDLRRGTQENYVKVAGLRAEISARDFPAKQGLYNRHEQKLRFQVLTAGYCYLHHQGPDDGDGKHL
jgi:hypothetical protein